MKSDENDLLQSGKLSANPLEGLAIVSKPNGNEVLEEDLNPWPDPPSDLVYHGPAGQFVRKVEPHSEADPIALLVQFLVMFGSVVGHGPHFLVEATQHMLNEFAILIGQTSKGRKGTAFSWVKRIFRTVDELWVDGRVVNGLSSGEGLIYAVRDPVEKKGEIVDEGEKDKRLLVVESEFASTLRVLQREGNTLSPIIRSSWDSGSLRTLTKNSPLRATGAHVSIIGHVTCEEALRYMDRTELGNGFANRFLWVAVRRSKCLPEGGSLRDEDLADIISQVSTAVQSARDLQRMGWSDNARAHWREVYSELSEGELGMSGAVTSRSEAHAMRLACAYAALDGEAIIKLEHLKAALALWDYCYCSARFVFGSRLGNPLADRIYGALRSVRLGLTRTEIRDLFCRNRSEEEIERALSLLKFRGLARSTVETTNGRPIERWLKGARPTI